jgi:hypothetical protein
MEFRLTYEGILLGASRTDTRAQHKHGIRRRFHPQLKRLWEVSPLKNLRDLGGQVVAPAISPSKYPTGGRAEMLAKRFARNNYNFIPLVTRELSVYCGIEVLFLRPDVPGGLVQSGDIDNRLKSLFDALRMPKDAQELRGHETPLQGENPFYCLLEDDRMISKITVETDTLLEPTEDTWDQNDTRLIITVRIRPYEVNASNLFFA